MTQCPEYVTKFLLEYFSTTLSSTPKIGKFHPFYRPRKSLGRLEVWLYSFLGPRHIRWGGGQPHATAASTPRERPSTHFIGDWVGPRAGLDGRKISSPPGFYPGPSSPQSVAIPTELPGPHPHNKRPEFGTQNNFGGGGTG